MQCNENKLRRRRNEQKISSKEREISSSARPNENGTKEKETKNEKQSIHTENAQCIPYSLPHCLSTPACFHSFCDGSLSLTEERRPRLSAMCEWPQVTYIPFQMKKKNNSHTHTSSQCIFLFILLECNMRAYAWITCTVQFLDASLVFMHCVCVYAYVLFFDWFQLWYSSSISIAPIHSVYTATLACMCVESIELWSLHALFPICMK